MSLPHAQKSLGQHWLQDRVALESIVESADVGPEDVVLEIGPGTGTLTDVLLMAGARVTALEFDRERADELKLRYGNNTQINIVEGDVRTFDLARLKTPYKIVANIPYYLTANLLRKLVDEENKPAVASLLVQKEVAERVCAGPGQLSQIAVFVQLYYEAELGSIVPSHLFVPAPKVDSQVLCLCLRKKPLFDINEKLFFRLVKAGFSERRKKLKNNLIGNFGLGKSEADSILGHANISSNARAQELSLNDWYALYELVAE